jgi:hypothetical protein
MTDEMKHMRTYSSNAEKKAVEEEMDFLIAPPRKKKSIGNLTPKGQLLLAVDKCLDEGRTREQILVLIDNYIYHMRQSK